MKPETWQTDRFRFVVRGRSCQRFFSCAAKEGVRLREIRCIENGYMAEASGIDRGKLLELVQREGWELETVVRRGPGTVGEFLLRRPGILFGLVFFVLLYGWLSQFVWSISFGDLPSEQQQWLRTQLAAADLQEGAFASEEKLQNARQLLALQDASHAWITLNFTGGCLSAEASALQTQPKAEAGEDRAWYAKVAGKIVALDVKGGFCAAEVGQYVTEGQLLVNGVKRDRSDELVWQPAQGRVMAQIERQYTAVQPLNAEWEILTGRRQRSVELHCLGRCFKQQEPESEQTDKMTGKTQVEWIPLTLGRIALPACIRTETVWETTTQTLSYSEATAQAMARRTCRQQLFDAFPDASIETQQFESWQQEDGIAGTMKLVFVADLARSGTSQIPPEQNKKD